MKKIIAFSLMIVTVLSLLAGCKKSTKGVSEVNDCYARSYPHKIVVETTQQFGSKTLASTTEVTRGIVGSDFVAKKKVSQERLRSIEDGSGVDVYGPVETINEEYWYREGKGLSSDKGKTWIEAGENFFPEKGKIAINLNTDLMDDISYANGTLSFTVAKSNTKAFFGEGAAITEPVSVKIYTAGGVVTSVEMSWVEPENTVTGVEMTTVKVKSEYIYDQQNITLN